MFDGMVKHLNEQKTEAEDLRRRLQVANREAIEASETAAFQLETTLQEEKQASCRDRENLFEQMKALMEGSARNQENRMSTRIDSTRTYLSHTSTDFKEADVHYGQGMDAWTAKERALVDQVMESRDNLKTRMKNDWNAVNEHNTSIQKSTKAVHEETIHIVDAQKKDMATQMEALDEFVTRARSQNDHHHDAHIESLSGLSSNVEQSYNSIGASFTSTTSRINDFGNETKTRAEELKVSMEPLEQTVRQPLSDLRSDIQAVPITEYTPTGETPQKREYTYPTTLPRTQTHDSLLGTVRKGAKNSPSKSSPTKLPTSSPSKLSSPSKTRVYNDAVDTTFSSSESTSTEPLKPDGGGGLREIDINVATAPPRPMSASGAAPSETMTSVFARSVGGGAGMPPPLKRHATADSKLPLKLAKMGGSKSAGGSSRCGEDRGRENNNGSGLLGQSLGSGGRRLRSSPQG